MNIDRGDASVDSAMSHSSKANALKSKHIDMNAASSYAARTHHNNAHSLPSHHPPPPQHKFNQHQPHHDLPLPSLSTSPPEVRNGNGAYHNGNATNTHSHAYATKHSHPHSSHAHRSHSQNAKHLNHHSSHGSSPARATSYPIQPQSLSHSQPPAAHRSVPLHMHSNGNAKHPHNHAHNNVYHVEHNANPVAMQLSSPEMPVPHPADAPLITIHRHHAQHHKHTHNNNNSTHAMHASSKTVDTPSDADIVDLSGRNGHSSSSQGKTMPAASDNHQVQYGHDGHVISLSPLQIVDEPQSKQQPPPSKHAAHRHRHRHHPQHNSDDDNEDDEDVEHSHDRSSSSASSASSSDAEFESASPVTVIAFDLDKTMVRTISLHTDEQPQPEQHPGAYFMFFDDDTKEYHHVYKRPHLHRLLDFLYSDIVATNKCKMMLCTHGTQKYAQTILERCDADKLFPLMLPRRDWCRRKFEDDYKPRRFKTLEKMAKSVNETVDNLIMIDDDPGVYSKGDRCNGSLIHIKPFDDPYEQRDDTELSKLITLLSAVLKYGKNYYNKLFANAIRYTGLVRTGMTAHDMNQHSMLRVELLKRLVFDCNLSLNAQEKLGTIFLFDRYCARQPVDWRLLQSNKHSVHQYVVLLFVCLFIARQYLYTDAKRPKQFRRDPYSAEIWLVHVELYEQMLKRYKIVNGGQESAHVHDHQCKELIPMPVTAAANGGMMMMTSSPVPTAGVSGAVDGYQTQTHHRRKRKHKNREKHVYFSQLHSIQNQILDVIEYPKLLYGLFHRPEQGYDSTLFVRYEKYVESLFHHIQQTQIQHKKHE